MSTSHSPMDERMFSVVGEPLINCRLAPLLEGVRLTRCAVRNAIYRELFDERNEAVKRAIEQVIQRAHETQCHVGICGQAPSDHPDFAEFLVKCGIDSISLNPDSVVLVIERLAQE
jgi:phosphoenolpyruvate synthase/pyruvate phosphate dikinase